MYRADPILENDYGKLRFLHRSGRFGDEERIAAGELLIPDVESLKRVQFGLHVQTSPWERYGEARVTNNLAAAYICLGRIQEALEATIEAEGIFREMLRSSNPHPATLTLVGFCISHYHLNLIHIEEGSVEPKQIEGFIMDVLSLLDTNEHLYRNPPGMNQTSDARVRYDFVRSALVGVVDTAFL